MKIALRLFAIARQQVGREVLEIELPESATVAELRKVVTSHVPELTAFGDQLRFAVNAEFVDDKASLSEGDDVACIPPVSGG